MSGVASQPETNSYEGLITAAGAKRSSAVLGEQRVSRTLSRINFAVPTRCLHNHSSMIERRDLDRAVDLLVALLLLLDAQTVGEISRF